MDFVGTGAKLTPEGIKAAADFVGCDIPAIEAVIEVETAGGGWDGKKRPKMLFEPHVFYGLLRRDGLDDELDQAVDEGIAYPKWGTHPYPKDSYPRLEEAYEIDPKVSLQSASWGLGQTMGQNYFKCGFKDVAEMVEAYKQGENEQLMGMAHFIKNAGLAHDLITHKWAAFAKGYNGPGYAKNQYDTKLSAAYAKAKRAPRP